MPIPKDRVTPNVPSSSLRFKSSGKGWADCWKSPKYLINAEKLWGKRCPKHATERLPCSRCKEPENETS
jgi:hypothetical protein